jgi:predicted dehydrogenase
MTVNVAFCGVGDLARPYLQALGQRTDVQVSAVHDIDPRAAEQVASRWGAKVVADVPSLLRGSDVQAVWICTPAHEQGEILEQVVAQRLPFFIEPPGAQDYAQAQRLAQQIQQARLVTAVGYSARHVDVIREAKEYLGVNVVPLAQGWWLTGPTRHIRGASGLLWYEACRLIDLLRYFGGEVAAVNAAGYGSEALTATLRLENGTLATLACGAYDIAEPRVELELIGEGWYFRFLDALTVLRLAERDKTTLIRQTNAPHAEHAAAFLEAVRSRRPGAVGCNYLEACQTLRVCHAALTALQAGCWVELKDIS